MDKLYNILYKNELRIHFAALDVLPDRIFFPPELDTAENRSESVSAACVAAVFGSELKEENSSVTVTVKNVNRRVSYCVTVQQNGCLCGTVSAFTPGIIGSGYVLEVVRRSGAGKDYSSVVCAASVAALTDEYIKDSMQSRAAVRIYGKTAVFAEELPFTDCLEEGLKALSVLEKNPSLSALKEENGFVVSSEKELTYGCTCSKRSARRVLSSLPEEERAALEEENEIICKFCGKKYLIRKDEI